MDTQNNNTTEYRYSIPKSGYGLYKLVLDLFLRHSDELVQELEKSHETRGRHGYPARDQIRVFLLQFLLNERYNSHLLNRAERQPEAPGRVRNQRSPQRNRLLPVQEKARRIFYTCWLRFTTSRYGTSTVKSSA